MGKGNKLRTWFNTSSCRLFVSCEMYRERETGGVRLVGLVRFAQEWGCRSTICLTFGDVGGIRWDFEGRFFTFAVIAELAVLFFEGFEL